MKNEDSLMMLSNLFLALPVIFAALYHQWLYCFFAAGLFIFSPLFHWYRITNRKSNYFLIFKTMDWLFALGAFIYMYYFIYHYANGYHNMLNILLSLVVVFFLYGWLFGNYKKLHPWFHIVAPIVSSIILIVAR